MYVPEFNREANLTVLHTLIDSKPLGIWISMMNDQIEVNHIPFLLHKDRGKFGTLAGHIAKANPIASCLTDKPSCVVVFQGDQAYVTPSWYPSKHQHGKKVPTWNYIVVHARGRVRVIDDHDRLLKHLDDLTDRHENQFETPWKVSDAPDTFIKQLSTAIVGFEIQIEALTGKWKLGQNQTKLDQIGLCEGLESSADPESIGLAMELAKRIE